MDDRSDVTNGVIQAYRNQGVKVVNGSQYAANSAYPLSISADGKTASVAGQTVEPLFIENGVAYFDSADIDRAIGAAKQQSGIQSRQEILNEQQAKYDPYYDHLLDQMVYRDEFDYDPNEDIVFQSYKDQYGREGDRAMRNAIGSMSGLTGGYANSAAVTAGAQQRQYWGDQLMDRIPELAAQAYERYVGDFDRNNQALNSVMGLDDMTFERTYGVNNDLINDVRYNNEANEARLKDARDWDYKVGRDKVSDAQWEKNHEQEVLNNQVDRTYTEASTGNVKADTEKAKAETEAINQQIKIDEINSVWDQALKRGSWGKPGSPEYNTAKELGFDIEQTPYYYYDHINEIYKIN